MKTKFLLFTLALGLAVSFGCQSNAKKVESAKENVRDANTNLDQEREDAVKAANESDWKVYKLETRAKIEKNDLRIAELQGRKSESGKALDNFYTNRINGLKQNNDDLRNRLDAYDKNGGDWERFKREFNRDLDTLGKALEGFGDKSK